MKSGNTAIEHNPNILGGKAVLAGTRISVEFLLELLASGMSVDHICAEYKLQRDTVLRAIAYASQELKRSDIALEPNA